MRRHDQGVGTSVKHGGVAADRRRGVRRRDSGHHGLVPVTAVAMSMRYGHLFVSREEHLTQALDRLYQSCIKA